MTERGVSPELRRGQVWWARVDKRRPVLLLSMDRAYEVRSRALVAEITTRMRHNSATVELGPGDGLPERCVVSADSLMSVALRDLLEYITTLSAAHMTRVCCAVSFATGCET